MLRSGVVERSINGAFWGRVGSVGRVFEEKYNTIDRLEGEELGGFKRQEFFELNTLDT